MRLAYNLGNFIAPWLPDSVEQWADDAAGEADQDRREDRPPRPLVIFQMAEVAIPRDLFADILRRDRLRTRTPA